jgi:hypothetical protein
LATLAVVVLFFVVSCAQEVAAPRTVTASKNIFSFFLFLISKQFKEKIMPKLNFSLKMFFFEVIVIRYKIFKFAVTFYIN